MLRYKKCSPEFCFLIYLLLFSFRPYFWFTIIFGSPEFLGQALLRSVKSMQRRLPPMCLGTTTPLESQVGWTTSLMMLAFFNFSTSLTMKSCFSGAWRRAFCFTGRAFGHTAKWCQSPTREVRQSNMLI